MAKPRSSRPKRSRAPFKSWSYVQAHETLWPAAPNASWAPWTKPCGDNKRPIDTEIEKLINEQNEKFPRMKSRADFAPLGSGTPNAYLQRAGDFDKFCPYREVRAHWIPFALQVARIQEERQIRWNEVRREVDWDIADVIRALERYRRHDPDTLAKVQRPLLARLIERGDVQPTASVAAGNVELRPVPGCEGMRLGPREKLDPSDVPRLHDLIARNEALSALEKAKAAYDQIEYCRNFAMKGKKRFSLPPKHQHEWEVAFAATLGFAWRRLTGRNPPLTVGGSPFLNFVNAAYQSLGRSSELSWARPCEKAAKRHRDDFSLVDEDPTLMIVAPEVWDAIPLRPAPSGKDTLLDDDRVTSVIDHILGRKP